MMAPIDDAIDSFTGITSLSKAHAVEWLKLNGNNVERAINAWMDNPVPWPPKPPAVAWDESEFHTDKSGNAQQTTGLPSFNVHPPDTLTPGVFGAPSRPPSRVGHSGNSSAPVPGAGRQQFPETEDEQMNRAMAISLSESQTLPGQETGVTNYGQTTFGPAQRDYYDASQWSIMTVPNAQAQEIVLDPMPFDRKRLPDTSAFFKPTPENYRLAALLKILHEIPLARKALLNESYAVNDYGHNSEWWNGTAIKILKVINRDQAHQELYAQDVICETQRLMAFLDKTERAYGSVEVLANLQGWAIPKEERISRFFTDWRESTQLLAGKEPLADMFQSRGIKNDLEEKKCLMDEKFCCLNVRVEQHLTDVGMSLYDALDEMMWTDSEKTEVFLADVAEVFTIEVNNLNVNSSGLGIEIPAVWYLDRYLESSTPQAKEMLHQKASVYEQLEELDRRQEKLLRYHKQPNLTIEGSSLLSKAIKYFEDTAEYHKTKAEEESADGPTDGNMDVLNDLKVLADRITAKLAAFERAKERAREHLREISQFYTKPTSDLQTTPTHKYTLRGVSTTPQSLYVLEKTIPEDEDDVLSSDAKDWQWWKFEYASINDSKPVIPVKVSEDAVLNATRMESTSAMLVYASEHAINYGTPSLIKQLENFARADNLHFSAELEKSDPASHLSPGKRKAADSDSDDLHTERSTPPPPVDDLDLDPDPPDYHDITPPSALPPPKNPRPIRPKISGQVSTDSNVPLSLHRSASEIQSLTVGASHTDLNDNQGQEMEERRTIRRKPVGQGKLPEYKLGSYAPEISVDDDEPVDGIGKQPPESAFTEGYRGRGTRDDIW